MYSGKTKAFLKNAEIGDTICISKEGREFEGVLMPRNDLADNMHIVIKLKSGYNIGCAIENALLKSITKKSKQK